MGIKEVAEYLEVSEEEAINIRNLSYTMADDFIKREALKSEMVDEIMEKPWNEKTKLWTMASIVHYSASKGALA